MHSSLDVSSVKRAHVVRTPLATRIGDWQLEVLLGEGRWARVYRARAHDACGNADYALKVLKPEFGHDPLAIGLLQQEARVARALSHPHLISILAAHTDGPPFYLVSPFLEGATLRELLRDGARLPAPHALWIARQTVDGLHALHRQGWLHHDIKPDNIFVTVNGHVTVCDLGLARPMSESGGSRALIAGTPAYLAPEVLCANVPLTAASDVFSLGVMLYESLTGQVPYPQQDPADLADALLTQTPPDPRHLAPHLPASVDRLLRRMLAKTPLRRPSLSELIDWLVDLEIETFDDRAA